MDKNILISPISVGDVGLLRTVALQAYTDHYLHLWHDGGEWYMNKSFSITQLTAELMDSNARFYLIYAENEPVGFLKLNIDAPFQAVLGGDALELERIYLTKAASGKGIGKEVVNFTITLAATLHKKTIWLKVMDSSVNPIAFYTKQGFAICGTHYLTMQTMKEEVRGMYLMKKEI